MAGISAYNSSSLSTLFSSLGTGSSNNNSGLYGLDFSTYNTIKTGTYKQLLKSYYGKNSSSKTTTDKSDSTNNATTTSSQKINAANNKNNAESLVKSSKELNKTSLWSRKEKTNEDGTISRTFDTDSIYKAVSDFVDNYNLVIKSAGDSDNKSVLRTSSNMVSYTKRNDNLLKEIGITVGEGNKLKIDKDTFMKADMTKVKSLFAGAGSYGQSVSNSVASVYSSAAAELSQLNSKSMYGSNGSYNYISAGSLYNQFV